MSPIDKDKITKLISQVIQSKKELEEILNITITDFLKDSKSKGATKYYLVIGIEAMINISNHIIAKEQLGTPDDYSDVFNVVNKFNLFSEELIKKLIDMARYRNKLVHLYRKIDDAELYDKLKDNIQTFELFEKSISKYLKNQKM